MKYWRIEITPRGPTMVEDLDGVWVHRRDVAIMADHYEYELEDVLEECDGRIERTFGRRQELEFL